MPRLRLQYDLLCPTDDPKYRAALYEAAIDQATWADRVGFHTVMLHEHHGTPDGYLPAPIVMAAGMATRTDRILIQLAAIIAPLHDPLRLAEDLAVLDSLSAGRLIVTLGAGYVPSECEMFDVAESSRVRKVVRAVKVLKQAWTGQPFEFDGRVVRVTPRPYREPGPLLLLAGSSEKAARRAARIADGYLPTGPETWEFFRDETISLGNPDPGPFPVSAPHQVFVSDDPDRSWHELGPALIADLVSYNRFYAAIGVQMPPSSPYWLSDDIAALRASGHHQILTPDECIKLASTLGPQDWMCFRPLVGGLDPELSWRSLHLFEKEVLPAISGELVGPPSSPQGHM